MGFTSIAALEQVRLANAAENNVLIEMIKKKNKSDPEFKDMQIVRYGDLVIAIHRPKKKALSGGVGTVYTAYPVQTDGTIDKGTPLVLKISRRTGLKLENGTEKFESTAETRELWSRAKKEIKEEITEQKKRHILIHMDNNLVSETINATTLVFSSRAATTSQQDKAGNTVHYRSILMSKVPGKSLDQLLADGFIGRLKPEERLRLALNVIRAYKELHAQGFYHRDIKAENIMIDPETLQVTVIDLDNRVSSCTRAPEDKPRTEFKPNAQSDSYSLGIDILPIILSGQRPREGASLPISVTAAINMKKWFGSKVIIEIKSMLNGMCAMKPGDRTTLAEAEEVVLKQLEIVRGRSITEEEIQQEEEQKRKHKESLRMLDTVLSDPKYKIEQKNIKVKNGVSISASARDGHAVLVMELMFKSANLAAEMIRDASQPNGAVKEDTVNKYNHIQQHIALLMGKSGYKSLTVCAETGVFQAEIVPVNNVSANDSVLEVDTEDQTEYLVETLEHIRKTKADKAPQPRSDSELPAKVDQTHPSKSGSELPKPVRSFHGHNLGITVQEKAKRVNQFSETFNADFLGKGGKKFIDSIREGLETLSNLVSKVKSEVPNRNTFFSHKPPTTPLVIEPHQEGHSISSRKSTAQV